MSDGGAAEQPEAKRQKKEQPEENPAEDTTAAASGDESSSGSGSGAIDDLLESLGASRPKPERVPFSLQELEAEIADLRASPPEYVSCIGELTRPSLICDDGGHLKRPDGEGPFDLALLVRGEPGDEAYGFPFKVSLRFDPDLWPSKLAVVRFVGVFHHALTDEGGGMLMPFYRALPRSERGACTVRLMLQAVHTFLVDPLSAWKIPAGKAPESFQRAISVHREMNADRLEVIRKYSLQRRHPELFQSPPTWQDGWLEPSFLEACKANTSDAWRAILEEHLPGEVFSFKIFTESFCKLLLDEIFNFYDSGLPARRPNSMNNYGIILNEIGLEPLINELQRMLQPLGELLFPGAGSAWDGQHCFIVRYRAGEDLGLDMHTDDSDVTFNICLGLDFAGAGLQFCGIMGAPNHRKHTMTYTHVKGSCVCHLGRKRHGADDISSGERLNLIMWNHSSTYRQSDEYIKPSYVTEESKPDAVCVSYTHDRDYGHFQAYPKGKEHFRGRGWCPRRSFEYSGFTPDCEKEQTVAH